MVLTLLGFCTSFESWSIFFCFSCFARWSWAVIFIIQTDCLNWILWSRWIHLSHFVVTFKIHIFFVLRFLPTDFGHLFLLSKSPAWFESFDADGFIFHTLSSLSKFKCPWLINWNNRRDYLSSSPSNTDDELFTDLPSRSSLFLLEKMLSLFLFFITWIFGVQRQAGTVFKLQFVRPPRKMEANLLLGPYTMKLT